MHIVVGSTSDLKITAVAEACYKLGIKATVSGGESFSRQNEQPKEMQETYLGALSRANDVAPENTDKIRVGIENGIFRFRNITLDFAFVVVLLPGGRQIVTTSSGVVFPEQYVEEAEKQGFKTTTAGSIISKELGGDKTDPHSTLTENKISRKDLLVAALVFAFKQF